MSDWGTPVPDLSAVHEAAQAEEAKGLDVHTITVMLNGQHGGWDVKIESTDEDMQDHTLVGVMDWSSPGMHVKERT